MSTKERETTDGVCTVCWTSGEAGYVCVQCNFGHYKKVMEAESGKRISSAVFFQPHAEFVNVPERDSETVTLT